MIVSRPKGPTIISFALFTLITLVVLGMNLSILISQPKPPWYTYAIVAVLIPILGVVIYRIFIRYKVMRFGNNQVEVSFPVLRKKRSYKLTEVHVWAEHVVKTGKRNSYRELEIRFTDKRKLSLGFQEYSDYLKVLGYLQMKLPKKRWQS